MQRALIFAAAIAACVSTADACPRCGYSYCKGCNYGYKPKSKALLPYGTTKRAPIIAEQGTTLILKAPLIDPNKALALLAPNPALYATAGERGYNRSFLASQLNSNTLNQITKGAITEGQLLAAGQGFSQVVRELQTTTETNSQTTNEVSESPDDIGDINDAPPNPVLRGNLGQQGGHPFQAVVQANCAQCHTAGKASGGVRLDDVSQFNADQWKIVRKAMHPLTKGKGHMPPGKQLTFEQTDLARGVR